MPNPRRSGGRAASSAPKASTRSRATGGGARASGGKRRKGTAKERIQGMVEQLNNRAAKFKRKKFKTYSGPAGGKRGSAAQRAAAKASGARKAGKKHYRKSTTAKTEAGKAWHRAVNGAKGQAIRDHDALRKFIRNNPGSTRADWTAMRKKRAANKKALDKAKEKAAKRSKRSGGRSRR